MAAGHSLSPGVWAGLFEELCAAIAGCFGRREPRLNAFGLVRGLMAELPRKNCWTIAEYLGHRCPDRLQHLLGGARWDAGRVRDAVRGFVAAHLGEPGGVLVVDETGDVKKGARTVGVQRQYTGTAGKVENSQVAVYLSYAGRGGHALVDRRLYLPRSWAGDPARRERAGVPAPVGFATKPELAADMIDQALDAGMAAAWAAADEVYGDNPGFRARLEARGLAHVVAIGAARTVVTGRGPARVDALAAEVDASAWHTLSCGAGAKGQRRYHWALLRLAEAGPAGGHRALLVRRHRTTGERAYFRCWSPRPVALAELVAVAGTRWRVEENFQQAKELAGLDEHQVRTWDSWHRWTTLAMAALAVLATATARERRTPPPRDMIPPTANEIRRLLTTLVFTPTITTAARLAWSQWRRRHQARARHHHYHRQALHSL